MLTDIYSWNKEFYRLLFKQTKIKLKKNRKTYKTVSVGLLFVSVQTKQSVAVPGDIKNNFLTWHL
jgi:hypothetical protein